VHDQLSDVLILKRDWENRSLMQHWLARGSIAGVSQFVPKMIRLAGLGPRIEPWNEKSAGLQSQLKLGRLSNRPFKALLNSFLHVPLKVVFVAN
jgi:hypothetical protein